ncbi:MAG: hypothetical protein HY904_09580 [Deltaproteobacteria bacterium]|nr:hypothetical protein [Deltaproteobacteria bacterium]
MATQAPPVPAAGGVTPWPPSPGRPIERYRTRVLVFLLSLALQGLTFGNRWGAPDERERVEAAESLLDRGTLRLPSGKHTFYPPLTSLLLTPGILARRILPGHDEGWRMVPSLVASAACAVPYQWALSSLGVPLGTSVAASALFALVNPVWPYSKRLYSEPFTAVFVLWALAAALSWRAHRRRTSLVAAYAGVALAAGNTAVALVLLPVIWGMTSLLGSLPRPQPDRRAAVEGAALGAAVLLAWMGVNYVKFGSPLESGYHYTTTPNDVFDGTPGFSTPLWVGSWGLLFSAGRGMILYAPLALVGVWALRVVRHRFNGAAAWLFLAGLLPFLVYAKWWSWHGGTCYGPRLLTPFLGAWLIGLGPWLAELRAGTVRGALTRAATALAAGLHVVASFTGTLFMFSYDQQFWIRERPFNDYLDVYTPQFSALTRSWENARQFPEDINWLWLRAGPRPALRLAVDPATRVVHVELTTQALRDTWEIAEVTGVRADGSTVTPATVTAREGRTPEAAADGNPATTWAGGTQRPGQYVRVAFGPEAGELREVVFEHGRQGTAYPRRARFRTGAADGALGPPREVEMPWPDLALRWPGWLCLVLAVICLRGAWRWWMRMDSPPPPPPDPVPVAG